MKEEPNQVNNNSQHNLQVQKSSTPADTEVHQGVKNTANKAAYKGAKVLGKVAKQFLKTAAKLATKAIVAIVSNPVALVVIAILAFLIIVIGIIANWKDGYVKEIYNKGKEYAVSAIEEAGSALSSGANALYQGTGSMLGYGKAGIDSLMNYFDQETGTVKDGTDEGSLIKGLSVKMGEGSTVQYLTPDDNVSLIQHMYSVSLYDFNNVKWKRYGHGYDGDDSPMTFDIEGGVIYPSDQNGTTFETFSTLLQPYLLSADVPMSFFTGLIDNENLEYDQAITMTYSFIKYGLSDITVNRYDVETCTEVTCYEDYDETTYYSEFTATITKQDKEWVVTFSNVSQVQVGDTVHVNTRLGDDGNPDYTKESTVIFPVKSYSNKYYIAEANVFDYKYENEFKYIKYSENDVKARINYDTEVTEEKPLEYEPSNKITFATGFTLSRIEYILESQVINEIMAKYGVIVTSNGDGTYTCRSNNYVEKDGKKYYVTRTWSDSLTQSGSTKGFYTVDDVIEYNQNCVAGTISEDDFKADTESLEYYEKLEENEKLNRMDFINSNPNIFSREIKNSTGYVTGDPYKKYVGINRGYLEDFSYNNLVDSWKDMENEYDTFPYKYGLTYGFSTVSDTASSSYLSGENLLKAFIHKHEGGTQYRYDADYNRVDTDEQTVYYKVYNANAGLKNTVDLTAGYGIDLYWQRDKLAELGVDYEEVLARYNSGEVVYLESEIIDKVEEEVLQNYIDNVKTVMNGIDLTEYQIHALVSHSYLEGQGGVKDFLTIYNTYWNEEDDLYEELYEKYKDTPEDATSIRNEIDFTDELYTQFFMDFNGDTETYTFRGKSEYTLFIGGYYDVLEQFWGNSSNPLGFQLVNGKDIDEEQCLALQTWFEDNIFVGSEKHASTDLYTWKNVQLANQKHAWSYGAVTVYLPDEYKSIAQINYYECPWWSFLRSIIYFKSLEREDLVEKIQRSNASMTGNGYDCAQYMAGYLNLSLNYEIDEIRANSVISFAATSSNSAGHTAYVEAVTDDCIIISHCGSGWYWHGVQIVKKSELTSGTFKFVSSVCLDDAL